MAGVCGDNRFEIIAKVKEHLIKATNIEMHPDELAQVDNILFRLWQCGYLKGAKKLNKKLSQAEADYDKMFWQKNETIFNLQEVDCDKVKKSGELCLGYGGDEDEPCEQCKNCIKCECGYYQLGETDKDEQLIKAKEIIEGLMRFCRCFAQHHTDDIRYKEAEQFLKE